MGQNVLRTSTVFVNNANAFYKIMDDNEKVIKNIFIGGEHVAINYECNGETALPHKFHNPVIGRQNF